MPPGEATESTSDPLGPVEAEDELGNMVLLPLESLSPAEAEYEAEAGRNGYYFVVFYAAIYNPKEDHIEAHAVSMFIGSNYLVTVHAGTVSHIADTIARWRAPRSPLSHRVSVLVHALLDAMVDDYFPLMDQVADRVEELEDTIFIHFDEGSIETMFKLKKDLLSMRRIVAPERDVLNVLLRRQLPIFALEDMAYLQDVYDHIVRVTDSIDTYRDLLVQRAGFVPVAPVQQSQPDHEDADHRLDRPDDGGADYRILWAEFQVLPEHGLAHRLDLVTDPDRRSHAGARDLLQVEEVVVRRCGTGGQPVLQRYLRVTSPITPVTAPASAALTPVG